MTKKRAKDDIENCNSCLVALRALSAQTLLAAEAFQRAESIKRHNPTAAKVGKIVAALRALGKEQK